MRNRTAGRAFEMLASIHKDQDYAATLLSYMLGGPLCIENCGVCCHQSFHVNQLSALYIANNVRGSLPPDRLAAITSKLRKWLLYPLPGVRGGFAQDGDTETALRRQEGKAVSSLWCPLLGEDNKCMLYPWRDPTCRAWGVTRTMAAICRRPVLAGETAEYRNYMSEANDTVKAILHQTAELRGLLQQHLPDALQRGWLPALLYKFLDPKGFEGLMPNIQEAKRAVFDTDLMWILTDEETAKYVSNTTLHNTIKVC